MEKFIKLFWIIFIIPLFIANTSYSQETYKGSWIISSDYIPDYSGYKNFKLDFGENGILNANNLVTISSSEEGEWDFTFSMGVYHADGEIETYINDRYYYYNNSQYFWHPDDGGSLGYQPQAQTIKCPWDDADFLMFASTGQADGDHHNCSLRYYEIDFDNAEPFIGTNFDTDFAEKSAIPIISNVVDEDGDRYIFVLFGHHHTDNHDLHSGEKGLKKYKITHSGISHEDDLLLDIEENGLEPWEYFAYNLEMQDKNEIEDPILAWITSPISNTPNSKIYIFDPVYFDGGNLEHYVLDCSDGNTNGLPETGIIAGIEFSPFPDEPFYMYVSCENLGLIKIDWRDGTLIEQIASGFSHSYVQTAPDGNVYVVSDDGTRFGKVDKSNGHSFDAEAFQYPFYVNQNGDTTTIPLTHINYKQHLNGGIEYYTLPENDQPIINIEVQAPNILCNLTTSIASIYVSGGIPPYDIEVKRGTTDVSDLFAWDEDYGCFRGTQLPAGTYEYTITDSGTTGENGIEGEFSITEGDAYDFEEDLLEINNQTAAQISGLSDMVWDENDVSPPKGFLLDNTIMFKHGFRLDSNTVLTINNLRLEFEEDFLAKVIIEPGSKLVLNNCTLTNYHCSDDPKKWAGIEVWGVESLPQTGNNQGELVLNNTTIEHAHEAVQLWNPNSENPEDGNMSGGIITAINSTFKNNRRAVSFMLYKNEPFGLERNYDAAFNHCDFINDAAYINDNPFYVFVSMWGVRGVQFKACDFINSPEFPERKAIYSLNAGYKLNGYCNGNTGPNGCVGDWIPNTFTNFEKAIESVNLPSNPDQYSINIWDSEFENNQYGIYMTTVNNAATMLYNKFQMGNSGNNFEKTTCGYFSTRGIQMNESFGFNIEENEFDKMQGNIDTDIVGVLVYKCPSIDDDIYKNQFYNLTAANQADSVNREESENDATGVSYYCNENSGNVHDFYITANQSMIRGDVGSLYLASGNKLSNTDIIFRNDYTQHVNYYYWAGDPDQILPDLDPNDYVIPDSVPFPNECLSNYGNNGGGIGIDPKVILSTQEKQEVEQEFYSNYQAYEAVNDLLIELKDGGSTEITNLSIAAAQPGDTWELRSNLLGMSPYLSKTVLMEAANRTDVLPESVLFEILSANPEELRKQDLMQHLETKDQPLPDYMLSILRQISKGSSAKTALLSQKAQHFAAKTKAAQKMILSIKNEEELDIVALRNWLGNMESLETDKQIVATYLYQDDYANANALLEMIPDLYNLQGEKLDEFNEYVNLLNLQIDLKQQNRNIFMLTDAEKMQLTNLAENSTGNARSGARGILSFVYGNQYCDCITPIEGGNKSSHTSYVYSNEDMAKALGFSVNIKPNPATVHTSIDYTLPIGVDQAELQLINTEGKIIWTKKVSGLQGQITIDIRSFNSGVYIFRLLSEEYSISESLIIN